jgi:hypothetical protein
VDDRRIVPVFRRCLSQVGSADDQLDTGLCFRRKEPYRFDHMVVAGPLSYPAYQAQTKRWRSLARKHAVSTAESHVVERLAL